MRHLLWLLAFVPWTTGCETPPDPEIDPGEAETPVTQVTTGRAGGDKDPEVSPDGRTIFYASSSFGENLDLYAKPIGSTAPVRLTRMAHDERFPKVNPVRPRTLAFCSNARGEWDIYVMQDYEKNPDQVTIVSEAGPHDIHPSWSPDGRALVYCSTDDMEDGIWYLKVVDLTTGKNYTLEGVDGLLPEWSPRNGDPRIVFQRMRQRDQWFGSLWTLEFDFHTVKNVTAVFSNDDWAAINPSWSPDGNSIVFATVGKSVDREGVLDEADDLWTVSAEGGHATRLTTSPAADWMPVWSRDDKIYFVSRRDGTDRLWSLEPPPPAGP